MKWQIKKYKELTPDEIYEILRIRNEVFISEQKCPYVDVDGKDKNSYHLFLSEGKSIIFYSRILEKGVSYDEISIGRVLVNSKFRGKSFARMGLNKAIEFIENKLNENIIKISAQAYLKKFYGSLGFHEVSEVYLEDEIPHIEMVYKSPKNNQF